MSVVVQHSSLPARRGLALISAAGVLWGTTGVVVHRLHDGIGLSPVSAGFYRLAVAAVALTALGVRDGGTWRRDVRAEPLGLLLAGLGLGAYQALYFVAVTDAGVGVSTVVSIGIAPLVTTAGEAIAARRRPSLSSVVSMLCGLAGLVLVTTAPASGGPRPLLGVLAATGSGLGFAGAAVLVTRLGRRVAPTTLTAASTSVGAVALAPLAAAAGLVVPARPLPLVAIGYLGVVTTALAYGLFYSGARTTTSSIATLLTLLEPLVATALGVLVLGERLTVEAAAGGALLLAAVALVHLRAGSGAT